MAMSAAMAAICAFLLPRPRINGARRATTATTACELPLPLRVPQPLPLPVPQPLPLPVPRATAIASHAPIPGSDTEPPSPPACHSAASRSAGVAWHSHSHPRSHCHCHCHCHGDCHCHCHPALETALASLDSLIAFEPSSVENAPHSLTLLSKKEGAGPLGRSESTERRRIEAEWAALFVHIHQRRKN
jgi:hypothetical protein